MPSVPDHLTSVDVYNRHLAAQEDEPSVPDAPDLDAMTKAGLTKFAKDNGVEVASKMTKAQIIEAINAV